MSFVSWGTSPQPKPIDLRLHHCRPGHVCSFVEIKRTFLASGPGNRLCRGRRIPDVEPGRHHGVTESERSCFKQRRDAGLHVLLVLCNDKKIKRKIHVFSIRNILPTFFCDAVNIFQTFVTTQSREDINNENLLSNCRSNNCQVLWSEIIKILKSNFKNCLLVKKNYLQQEKNCASFKLTKYEVEQIQPLNTDELTFVRRDVLLQQFWKPLVHDDVLKDHNE